jgi:uncharacterized protein YkwD
VNKNKLAIVLVISILVNGLVLGCGRVDNTVNLDEIETTTFAIIETTDINHESDQKHFETEITLSPEKNTIMIESLEESFQQAMQPASNSDINETSEQNKKTTSSTVKASTEQSKSDVTETTTKTIEKTTTQSDKAESTTKITSDVPATTTATDKPTPATAPPPTPTPTPEFYNRVDPASFIQQAFAEVNRMRAEAGQDPVVMASILIQDYAMLRAKEEGQDETGLNFDHIRPNGEGALDYLDQLFYDGSIDKQAISENITTVAALSSYSHYGDGMVRKFQSSVSHYNSIISPDAGFVGIGYYYNENAWLPYIVLIFQEK